MITLPNPVTVTPPSIHKADGTTKTFPARKFTQLTGEITDNPERKTVRIGFDGIPLPLTLWSGDAYSAVGNWTMDQVNARVLELLGSDPAIVLQGLFQPPH